MSNEFLQARHAAYQTPERVLRELIRRATGREMAHGAPVVWGYDCEVYAVTTAEDEAFILRIRHHGDTDFVQEVWALEQCRAAGVPVPEILFLDTIAFGNDVREAMVQRKVPGVALSERMDTLTPDELARVWGQAGETLGRIHSIQVNGFYKRRGEDQWDFPDWDSLMQSACENRAAEFPLLRQAGFTDAELDTMLAMMEQYRREFVCRQPVLCHGDFKPAHLFVTDDLTLSGIIDFGEFQGGPPIHDFAYFAMVCPQIDLRWLQAGYPDRSLFDDRFISRLLLHKVGMEMGYLTHSLRQNDTAEALSLTKSLRGTLAQRETLP